MKIPQTPRIPSAKYLGSRSSTMLVLVLLALAGIRPAVAADGDAGSQMGIGLKLILKGIGAPMALAPIPDGSGRMLLAEQNGVIHLLDRDGKRGDPLFLDLRPKMVAISPGMEERGLLGLALHPQFKSNGKYIFGDWSRNMAVPDGTLLVATIPSGNAPGARWVAEPLALREFPNGRIKSYIWAFGEDAEGELYVLANGINSAFGTRGKVFKLVPQSAK